MDDRFPPGRYRVRIVARSVKGAATSSQGKYSPENSRIEVEVKDGEDVVIDLATYQ